MKNLYKIYTNEGEEYAIYADGVNVHENFIEFYGQDGEKNPMRTTNIISGKLINNIMLSNIDDDSNIIPIKI